MKPNYFCARIFLVLLFLIGGAQHASSQVMPGEALPPPLPRESVDFLGIDMISGEAQIPGMQVSIGGESSGIHYAENQWNSGRTNFQAKITALGVNSSKIARIADMPQGLYYSVNTGSYTTVFKESASGELVHYENGKGALEKSGATTITHTAQDGTVYLYDTTYRFGYDTVPLPYWQASIAALTQITKPNGEIVDLAYQNLGNLPAPWNGPLYRLSSVSSSLGWMIKYQGSSAHHLHSASVMAINTSMEYCDPGSEPCDSLSYNWPNSTLEQTATENRNVQVSGDYSRTYSGTVTNALGELATLSYDYYYPVRSYEITHVSPTGLTRVYEKSLCKGMLTPPQCNTEVNVDKDKVVRSSIGPNSFEYSRRYIIPIEYGQPNIEEAIGPEGKVMYPTLHPGQLMSSTDNLGRYSPYSYEAGRIKTITIPGARNSKYEYDSRGNILSATEIPRDGEGDPLVTSAVYPDCTSGNSKYCNKPTSVTDPGGVTTRYTYHPQSGMVQSITRESVDGVQAQVFYTYAQQTPKVRNADGQLVNSTPVWRLAHASKCMTATLRSCAGTADEQITEYAYDHPNVLLTAITERLGDGSQSLTTTLAYDGPGEADGEFDGWGNIYKKDGPRPGDYDATFYYYDALRRVTHEIGPDPDGPGPAKRIAKRITYNGDGNVISEKTGLVSGTSRAEVEGMTVALEKRTEYKNGLPVLEKVYAESSLTAATQKNYDSRMRLKCSARRLNSAAWNSLPADACTLGPRGPEGDDRITQYFYDDTNALLYTRSAVGTAYERTDRENVYRPDNGLLDAVKDGLGNTTFYTYDSFYRPEKTIYPDKQNGSTASQTDYTQNFYSGNVLNSVRLRDGIRIFFEYDALNRPVRKRLGSSSGALLEFFRYNNFDQVVEHHNYTPGYDGAGNIGEFGYSALGWKKWEKIGSTDNKRQVSYGYNDYGQRTRMTWPDGFYVTYAYDYGSYPAVLLQSIKEKGAEELANFEYDAWGRRSLLIRGNGAATSYEYDALSRLDSLVTDLSGSRYDIAETFSYTTAGQLKSHSFDVFTQDYIYPEQPDIGIDYGTPNALNQYVQINGVSIAYDERGNLTSDGNAGYGYNINNLLTEATTAQTNTTLRYDSENRLSRLSTGEYETRLLYDGEDMIGEMNTSGEITGRYVHGPEVDDPIVWYSGDGTEAKHYLAENHQGSIVSVSDASGATVSANAYDEYGIPAEGNSGRFQYTGQVWLPEIGLYYYKARLYNPELGRFLQTDPVGYEDQMNLYAYVHNDPLNFADPTGKSSVFGGTSAPTMQAVQQACGGDSSCVQQVASDMLKAEAAIVSTVIPVGEIAIAAAAVKASNAVRSAKAAQLAKNAANGRKAENTVVKELGDQVAGQRVTFKTSDGTRAVPDIVTKDKGIVEVKSGNGKLSTGQRKLFDDVEAGRKVTPVGRNAEKAGLTPGKPIHMTSCKLERRC